MCDDLLLHGLMSLPRYSLRGLMTVSVVLTKHFLLATGLLMIEMEMKVFVHV